MIKGLVSIIVAAYNAADLLPKSLDSLLGQTYHDLEIFVVNDASTDGTQAVIDRYAAHDPRIIPMVMPENGGQVAARNEAMKVTQGEFMTMVDADDMLAPDAIELSVKELQADDELDLVTYDMQLVYPHEGGKVVPYPVTDDVPEVMTAEEACYHSILFDYAPNGVSRSPLEQNMLADTTVGDYGDEVITHLLLLNARKVKRGKGKYFYYQWNDSYTHRVSMKRFDILECRQMLRRKMQERNVSKRIMARIEEKRWMEFNTICHFFWKNRHSFTEAQQQEALRRMKETYDTFSWRDFPLTTVLKPRFMMLPSFVMYYRQVVLVFQLNLVRIS